MSPSPNQFPQSSKGSEQPQTAEPVIRRPNPPKPAPPPAATAPPPAAATPTAVSSTSNPANTASDSASEANSPDLDNERRNQPIPPPSEPMQYRAIGLVRGKYTPSAEQFTRGMLVATDETAIDAVLLGRIMSLVKNHLDLNTEHLWVVYPRTRQQDDDLHVQIVGVWEPEKLDKTSPSSNAEVTESTETSTPDHSDAQSQGVEDGYFSIRGEVVYQSQDDQKIIVKIKQAPRQDDDKPKFFKLTLKGLLEKKAVGFFWDFQVRRQVNDLLIQEAKEIGPLRPRKPRKPFQKGGRPGGGGGFKKPWKQGYSPRPDAAPKPITDKPVPRPVKRQQPTGDGSK